MSQTSHSGAGGTRRGRRDAPAPLRPREQVGWSGMRRPLIERARKVRGLARVTDQLVRVADVRSSGALRRIIRWTRVAGRDPLPTYWFHAQDNLGDLLAPVALAYVSGLTPALVSKHYSGKVLAVGSVLQNLQQGDIVWGAGAIRDVPIQPPPGVQFLAVRGPLTWSLIHADVPEVYGDPALLLPLFFRPATRPRCEIGLVPHAADWAVMRSDDPNVRVIDVTGPWQDTVSSIASCEIVVSSSLHGIIVAETYGVPAVWVRAGDRLTGGSFKFDDYYLSTGRDRRLPVDWNEGLAAAVRAAVPPPALDAGDLLDAWPPSLRAVPG
jgi:pyruvyltransferase